MASQAYYEWVDAGRPYTRARPTLELRDLLRGYGYTVYDYPDDPHLQAVPPEDHTPFSATGWPITSKRWVGHAIDIMPPSAAAIAKGAVPLTVLARQIIADKDAGVPGTKWLKYINWTDEQGRCWHTSWQPDKRTVSSTDKGHIHLSARSDVDTSSEVSATGWDPVEASMSLTAEERTWLYNIYLGMFSGGSSCGEKVTAPNGVTGNAMFTKLDYQNGLLRQINTASGASAAALAAQAAKLDEILTAALDDGDATVVLPPEGIAALEEIKVSLAALQTSVDAVPEKSAQATVDEIAS